MNPDSQFDNFSGNLADLSGSELLRRWKNGDERAANCIAERYAIRLVAMVSSKLNRRYRDSVDPDDIVQSAMGSFFVAARQSRIQVGQSVSLWRLLATFAKRKMLRSIERQTAIKRGGDAVRVPIQEILQVWAKDPSPEVNTTIDDLLGNLDEELPTDLREVLDGTLLGQTQQEIAEKVGITERTVRRRMTRLLTNLSPDVSGHRHAARSDAFVSQSLPRVGYNEFVLGRLVGSGGFGKVYRATMQANQETVAVKFLRKAFWQDTIAKESFLREIDQAAKIQHSSVVRYLGWGESPQGGPYVITEWIDGLPLAQAGEFSAESFLAILHTICDALQKVHRLGVIHGDLTPNNILVDNSKHVWITDFGFAQPTRANDHVNEIEPVLGGTLGFAAPEQISESFGQISPVTDVYSIGGLAFWFLTGRAPHAAATTEQSIFSTIAATNVDTESLPSEPEAIGAIKRIATAALQKPIRRRPSTVAELINRVG